MMFSTKIFLFALLGLASARPNQTRDATLAAAGPPHSLTLTRFSGTGCPANGDAKLSPKLSTTWSDKNSWTTFISFPSLKVELGKNDSLYCFVYFDYKEFEGQLGSPPPSNPVPASKYYIRGHTNGTNVRLVMASE
jgi:hypothetical protein